MNKGQVISGVGHATLIGWVIFGGAFESDPLPFEVTEVSVISSQAFESLLTKGPQPDTTTDVALPLTPEPETEALETPAADTVIETETPEAAPTPEAEEVPEEPLLATPPDPDVADISPEMQQPEQQAVLVPDIAAQSVPRPSERVAPEAVATPDPEAKPDNVEQQAVTEDAEAETEAEKQEATAPEEAATEIVTEAEKPAAAPRTSLRPPARRPNPPAKAVESPQPEQPATDDTPDAVEDALRQAIADGGAEVAPTGPPLSAGEKDALRVAVSNCWNVGSLSSEALMTTVVVAVDMTQDGKPVISSIRLLSSTGGSEPAAKQAFEAARRAIIRCTRNGYDLPVEKYGQWKEIEMTFNPERMRIK